MKMKRCTNSSCRKAFRVETLACPHCGKKYPRESVDPDVRGRYAVVLTYQGASRLALLRVILAATGLCVKDAREVAGNVPSLIVTGFRASQAEALCEKIRATGSGAICIPANRGTKGIFVLPKKKAR